MSNILSAFAGAVLVIVVSYLVDYYRSYRFNKQFSELVQLRHLKSIAEDTWEFMFEDRELDAMLTLAEAAKFYGWSGHRKGLK